MEDKHKTTMHKKQTSLKLSNYSIVSLECKVRLKRL